MISIIVPVYNVKQYINQCIDSIICQSYTDLEIILIDDGSTDGSGSICDDYAAKDSRIRVFHTENRGLSAARNLGIGKARGDYLSFIDSDDWIDHTMYELLMKAAIENQADMVICGFIIERIGKSEKKGNCLGVYCENRIHNKLIHQELTYAVWARLYRSELFDSIRFLNGHVYEDVAPTLQIIHIAKNIYCINDALYHYRIRSNSVSSLRTPAILRDYWNAQKIAFDTMFCSVGREEQMILVRECINAAIMSWSCFYSNSTEERKNINIRPELKVMSQFVRQYSSQMSYKSYSFSWRTSLWLARYDMAWAFALSNLKYRLAHIARGHSDSC